jgi:hypothetical protein
MTIPLKKEELWACEVFTHRLWTQEKQSNALIEAHI